MGHVISIDVLLEEFSVKIAEAKEIYNTLKILHKYAAGQGQDFELPDVQAFFAEEGAKEAKSVTIKIRSDEFFGMSNTEAAEKYLKKIGHAMTLGDIYAALTEGGITFSGDGRKSLYTQLVRATRKFSKIGGGPGINFGLNEWYPARRKKSDVKEGVSSEEEIPEGDEPSPVPSPSPEPEEEKE